VEGADITHADTNLLAAGGVGGGDILKEFMRLAIDDENCQDLHTSIGEKQASDRLTMENKSNYS